jgi:hypothetical protein
MKIGIVGLPFSGKTTLFEAITGTQSAAMEHGRRANRATVVVPDERLDTLAALCDPRKVTPAHIDFIDVAGVSSAEARERAEALLAPVRDAEGLLHVVRFFDGPSAPPHPRGSLDPVRDADELRTELIVIDLDVVERRIEKLEKQVAKPTPHQDEDRRELALQERIKTVLERGEPVSSMELAPNEAFLLRSFQLLSGRPLVQVLNAHEDKIYAPETRQAAARLGETTLIISARIEKEIAELDEEERGMFMEELGIDASTTRRVIRACYDALSLQTFFTGASGGDELRAWTVHAGATARAAAGKVHSDMQRGFIRAEVVAIEDLLAAGGLKEAKAGNKMRLEGKDYVVADGDVITFRFKV